MKDQANWDSKRTGLRFSILLLKFNYLITQNTAEKPEEAEQAKNVTKHLLLSNERVQQSQLMIHPTFLKLRVHYVPALC